MVRISKQNERRQKSPRRHKKPMKKTGPLKDNLSIGYKPHANALEGDLAKLMFIPKLG
ncbi:MAG: hypothetical protein WC222_12260 [Parachlamydiales bacterium]|jgi:hypothetical protein